ncbi:MAG: hypothetical protein U9N57_15190 [Pseudomonadota bacterium]|nr:hypothetical protein [Pseudomonadota bacterium]
MDNLQIGTYGWQYDSWIGGFYPEDIPKDWQLDYYSNAYRVILVPEQAWLSWAEDGFEEILDAVEGDFGFYFEVVDELASSKEAQLTKIVSVFSETAKGVVVFSERDNLASSYCGLSVTLISKNQVLPAWQWKEGELTCSGEPCGVVFDLTSQPKEQTALLKSFVGSFPRGYEGAPLFVRGEEINMEQVYNLKTIGEFLGY